MLTATAEESRAGSRIAPLEPGQRPRPGPQRTSQGTARVSDDQLLDFVDAFVHDTNGSLFVAAEFTELLAEGAQGNLNPEQQRLLQIIHDRTYTVHDILESLHWAVKLRAGGDHFMPRPSSVQEVLELTIPRLLRRARSRIREFRTNVRDTPPTMRCDPNVASLILVNLFTHVSYLLNNSHTLTLQVEPLPGRSHNACRFIVTSGTPPFVRTEACTGFNAYFDLAATMADETNCFTLDPDVEEGELAGVAIPTDETDNAFLKPGE